jgi:hypothetical protein
MVRRFPSLYGVGWQEKPRPLESHHAGSVCRDDGFGREPSNDSDAFPSHIFCRNSSGA